MGKKSMKIFAWIALLVMLASIIATIIAPIL